MSWCITLFNNVNNIILYDWYTKDMSNFLVTQRIRKRTIVWQDYELTVGDRYYCRLQLDSVARVLTLI